VQAASNPAPARNPEMPGCNPRVPACTPGVPGSNPGVSGCASRRFAGRVTYFPLVATSKYSPPEDANATSWG